MGLSIIIAGGIVLFALVYILLTMPGVVNQTVLITKASTDISDVENSLLRTNIEISLLSAASGSDAINFTVNNVGTEKLWDFAKFNLIISYDTASGSITESLDYAGTCSAPASGTWCATSTSADNIDPNILNTDESLNARSRVSSTPISGTVIITFSTDNGIVSSRATST
jgi:hypothetical protein